MNASRYKQGFSRCHSGHGLPGRSPRPIGTRRSAFLPGQVAGLVPVMRNFVAVFAKDFIRLALDLPAECLVCGNDPVVGVDDKESLVDAFEDVLHERLALCRAWSVFPNPIMLL